MNGKNGFLAYLRQSRFADYAGYNRPLILPNLISILATSVYAAWQLS